MNIACDYEAPMQMLTTEKYIAARYHLKHVHNCFCGVVHQVTS